MSVETYTCGHCHFEFNRGVTTCQGCLGTVVWGATQKEKHEAGLFGAFVGAAAGGLVMFGLPAGLNKYLATDVAMGFGFGIWALMPIAVLAAIGYVKGTITAEKQHRGECRTFR